jgi:hypothetical protein
VCSGRYPLAPRCAITIGLDVFIMGLQYDGT